MRIAICDDDINFINKIEKSIKKATENIDEEIQILKFKEGNKLLKKIRSSTVDIVLLDVDMPDISGLEIAKIIRNLNNDIILIFISAYEQFVFESIEFHPFRYIRKTYFESEFSIAIMAAIKNIKSREQRYFVIKSDYEYMRVSYSDIMYGIIADRKLDIHLITGEIYPVRKTIKEFISELNLQNFIQVNSGCVVNIKFIKKFTNIDLLLDNDEQLLISRNRLKDVKAAMLRYWREKI